MAKLKHYADKTHGRDFRTRMRDRLNCKFPLSFYAKMMYPYFCIVILNDDKISNNAKREFIEHFVKPYISNEEFVYQISTRKISFTSDNYLGCLKDSEIKNYIDVYTKMNTVYDELGYAEEIDKLDIIITMFNNYDPTTVGCVMGR